MGTGRPKQPILAQNPIGLSAPRRQEGMWRRVHRHDAWLAQGRRCKWCESPLPREAVTADHKRAVKNGGTTSSDNIYAACQPCNLAKGHLPEKSFKRAIRHPEREHRMAIWLAWSRRALEMRTQAAERRILSMAGVSL